MIASQGYILSTKDEWITRDDSAHIYYINGEKQTSSVTTYVGTFFDHFDRVRIITNCAKKETSIPVDLRFDYISTKWNSIAEIGTVVHKKIEDYLTVPDYLMKNDDKCELNYLKNDKLKPYFNSGQDQEIIDKKFSEFLKLNPLLTKLFKFCASEYMVHGKVGGVTLCGTIDALYYTDDVKKDPNNKHIKRRVAIVDWKTNEDVIGPTFKVKAPEALFYNVGVRKIDKYACQLHCYKYILEEYYNVIVEHLIIVNFTMKHQSILFIDENCKCFEEYKKDC